MKLCPQPAGILPPSPKVGGALLRGRGAFFASIEGQLATFCSDAGVSHAVPGCIGGHSQVSTREAVPMSHAAPSNLSGTKQKATDTQTKTAAVSTPAIDVTSQQAAGIETLPGAASREPLISKENIESLPAVESPVPPAAAPKPTSAASLDCSTPSAATRGRRDATHRKRNEANGVTISYSPNDLPPSSQNLPQTVAVIAPQSEPHAQVATKHVQPINRGMAAINHGVSGPTILQPIEAPGTIGIANDEHAEGADAKAQLKRFTIVMDEHSPPPVDEKNNPRIAMQFIKDSSPVILPHPGESRAIIGLLNEHPFKEAEKNTDTTGKAILLERVQVSFPSPAVQHLPVPNTPVAMPAVHRMQQAAGNRHADTNAAQVLHRMDMAVPSGFVQLRADTRHLDVGISSGSLGWVEVRATAGPSGKVDAALHLETNTSAHVVAAQSKELMEYAREHSVQLGQLSVGVGTGDGSRGSAGSMYESPRGSNAWPVNRRMNNPSDSESRSLPEKVSLISIRA